MESGGRAGVRRCTAGGAMISNAARGDQVSLVVVAVDKKWSRRRSLPFGYTTKLLLGHPTKLLLGHPTKLLLGHQTKLLLGHPTKLLQNLLMNSLLYTPSHTIGSRQR